MVLVCCTEEKSGNPDSNVAQNRRSVKAFRGKNQIGEECPDQGDQMRF
jgi:hypothetical protein